MRNVSGVVAATTGVCEIKFGEGPDRQTSYPLGLSVERNDESEWAL